MELLALAVHVWYTVVLIYVSYNKFHTSRGKNAKIEDDTAVVNIFIATYSDTRTPRPL